MDTYNQRAQLEINQVIGSVKVFVSYGTEDELMASGNGKETKLVMGPYNCENSLAKIVHRLWKNVSKALEQVHN